MTRRRLLGYGGGVAAAVALGAPAPATSGTVVEVAMAGTGNGSRVWFDPIGLLVQPGRTIRWINRDPGNAHTATAYHPSNFDRPRRIPPGAAAWDSDYLLPGEVFEVTLSEPGVYDYYCVPHEMAGMVGRIVVGMPGPVPDADDRLPAPALRAFPAIREILEKGVVRHR